MKCIFLLMILMNVIGRHASVGIVHPLETVVLEVDGNHMTDICSLCVCCRVELD